MYLSGEGARCHKPLETTEVRERDDAADGTRGREGGKAPSLKFRYPTDNAIALRRRNDDSLRMLQSRARPRSSSDVEEYVRNVEVVATRA